MAETFDIAGRRVLVVGLGASGVAACRLAVRKGAQVAATDLQTADALGREVAALRETGVALHLGAHPEHCFLGADVVVVSPGVPPAPILDAAGRRGAEVMAEVEFACRFVKADIVGVTGSNGKSTTTSLLGEMARRSGRPCFAGGNLGSPLCLAVDTEAAAEGGLIVVELSSFQLELVSRFRPAVAVLTNLSEDHLDRYPSFDAYIAAKARIFMNQTPSDHAVVGAGDPRALAEASAHSARVHVAGGPKGEVRREGAALEDRGAAGGGARYDLSGFGLAGEHNVTNACMAALAARLVGVPAAAISEALGAFEGLPHRMTLVAEWRGVRFYDDSKATNVGAAVEAIRGMDRPVVLIAGGRDKGGSYEPLRRAVSGKARRVVLVGEAADRMATALAGAAPIERAGTFREAVAMAVDAARAGDAVLLAPACSSYDMFRNFEHRGEVFRDAVLRIAGQGTATPDQEGP